MNIPNLSSLVLIKTLRYYYKNYPRQLLIVTILLIISAISESIGVASLLPVISIVTQPDQLAAILNQLPLSTNSITYIQQQSSSTLLVGLLALLVCTILTKAIFSLLAIRSAGYTRALIAKDYRLRIIEALSNVRWSFFTKQRGGALVNAVSNEPDQAARCFMTITTFLAALCQCIVYGLIALWGAPLTTLSAALIGIMLFFAVRILSQLRRQVCMHQVDERAVLSSWMNDIVSTMKGLKAMNLVGVPASVVETSTQKLDRLMQRETMYSALQTSMMEPVFVVSLAIGIFVFTTIVPVETTKLVFMLLIFQRLMSYLSQLMASYQNVLSTAGILEKMEDHIADIQLKRERTIGSSVDPNWRSIKFNNITLKYDSKTILEHFDLEITRGKLTLLCGPSGSGKTSLLDMMTGLNLPAQGTVCIGKTDLNSIALSNWRNQIGYVPQEPLLLNSTIRHNLVLTNQQVSDAELWAALTSAGLSQVVSALPDKLDSSVGERGNLLSGGQRQRLAIARALIKKPNLLILDEATSSLDEKTSREIAKMIKRLVGTVTVIAVSHKDDFIPYADMTVDLSRQTYTLKTK